jgi:starch synthase (maltosyl-transferring)
VISKINAIRKDNPAFQQTNNIRFCAIENEQLLAFYKWDDDKTNEFLIIISLDPHYTQRGQVQLPMDALEITAGHPLEIYDVITNNGYIWYNEWNFIELHPALPFHLFHIKK